MTKQAHVTSAPDVEVGTRAIALCGKAFRVKVAWHDVPRDKPLCRDCVDVALAAMTQADAVVEVARRRVMILERGIEALADVLNPPGFYLDEIAEDRREWVEAERASRSCSCTWGPRQEIVTEDPSCPIHGGGS